MELKELLAQYKVAKIAFDKAKKEEDRIKKLVKEAMREAEEKEYTDEDGYKFIRSVEERKSFDKERLLSELHDRGLEKCIKTVEDIDEDATIKAVEDGDFPQETLAECLDVKEIVLNKMQKTRLMYPVSKSRGVSTKYDKL